MNVKHANIKADWTDPDEIPDTSSEEWDAVTDAAVVQRGRPVELNPKKATSIRLDADVIEAFKADGPGWQSRMNAALRKAAGLS